MKTTLPLLLMAGAGLLLVRSAQAARQTRATATALRSRVNPDGPIRAAGPQAMQNPPDQWDIVDEQSDQSFPASDPPGNY
ncbi:MAG: hypothetical protein CFE34_13085 [Rhodobacteraceae bacterium PARR1]|nr:MAG: hypothetical protein CFE34_13085 [Rhodobacteraceae bacterium PARR1]